MFKYFTQGLGSIAGLRYYLNVGFVLEEAPYTLAQQDMVVHQGASNLLIVSNLCVRTHRRSFVAAREFVKRRELDLTHN
jgi:hypothetical protein